MHIAVLFFSGLFVSVYPTKRLEYRTAVLLYAATYCFCYIIHCSTIQMIKVHLHKYRNTEITSFECFKSFFFLFFSFQMYLSLMAYCFVYSVRGKCLFKIRVVFTECQNVSFGMVTDRLKNITHSLFKE